MARCQRLVFGAESRLDRLWSGLDQVTRPSDNGRNLLVATTAGNDILSRLRVSQDVYPRHLVASTTQATLESITVNSTRPPVHDDITITIASSSLRRSMVDMHTAAARSSPPDQQRSRDDDTDQDDGSDQDLSLDELDHHHN